MTSFCFLKKMNTYKIVSGSGSLYSVNVIYEMYPPSSTWGKKHIYLNYVLLLHERTKKKIKIFFNKIKRRTRLTEN